MSLLYIVFIILILIVAFLLIVFTVFANIMRGIVKSISKAVFSNAEECPLCHHKRSMRTIKTPTGHKKICHKCGFSVESDDDDEEI